MSPDGGSLYVASKNSDSVSHFFIAPGGSAHLRRLRFPGWIGRFLRQRPGLGVRQPRGGRRQARQQLGLRPLIRLAQRESLLRRTGWPDHVRRLCFVQRLRRRMRGHPRDPLHRALRARDQPERQLPLRRSADLLRRRALHPRRRRPDDLRRLRLRGRLGRHMRGDPRHGDGVRCAVGHGDEPRQRFALRRLEGLQQRHPLLRGTRRSDHLRRLRLRQRLRRLLRRRSRLGLHGSRGYRRQPRRRPPSTSLPPTSDSLSHFSAAPAGQITFSTCVSNLGSAGQCANVPGSAFDEPIGVAVSPDGSSVFAAASSFEQREHLRTRPAVRIRRRPTRRAPRLTLRVGKTEAGKPVKVTVSCDEACSVDLTGTAKPKGSKKREPETGRARTWERARRRRSSSSPRAS